MLYNLRAGLECYKKGFRMSRGQSDLDYIQRTWGGPILKNITQDRKALQEMVQAAVADIFWLLDDVEKLRKQVRALRIVDSPELKKLILDMFVRQLVEMAIEEMLKHQEEEKDDETS